MDRKKDLEQSLRDVNAGPDERVKHSVMNEYALEFQNGHDKKIWERAVPLYKAVAAAILIALASALTGGYIVSSVHEQQNTPTFAESSDAVAVARLKPVIAESDAF